MTPPSKLTPQTFGFGGRAPGKRRMRMLGDILVSEWAASARAAGLRSTLRPYIQAIGIRRVTEDTVVVELPGSDVDRRVAMLARMVEFGMGPGGIGSEGPYDVRAMLLRSSTRSIRYGKTGPYVNVPFRMLTKRIGSLEGGAAMAAARGLAATRSSGRRLVYGGRYQPGHNAPTGRIRRNPNTGHAHRVHLLANMVRLESTYSRGPTGARRQSTYQTWRRASYSGQPWISRGIKARRLGEKLRARVPDLVRRFL